MRDSAAMAYRKAEREPKTQADRELEELAARGRQLREAGDERAAGAREQQARRVSRARSRHAQEALVQNSWTFFAWIFAAVAIGAGGLVLFPAVGPAIGVDKQTAMGIGVPWMLAWGVAAWCGRYVIGARLMRQERAWLASLPFPVDGYLEAIEAEPCSTCTLVFDVALPGDRPDDAMARDLLAVVDAQLESFAGDRLRARGRELRCSVRDGPDNNGPVARYARRVIRELALPLHGRYRVASLRFRRD